MVIVSGSVSQTPSGSVLTFTDTSTGVSGLISRILNIYDPNGILLSTVNMGATLTATYDISGDGYFQFIETIVDGTGTYVLTINYLSTAFTDNVIVNTLVQLGCSCSLESFNFIDIAYFFRFAALRLALGGFGVAAQANILAAYSVITGG